MRKVADGGTRGYCLAPAACLLRTLISLMLMAVSPAIAQTPADVQKAQNRMEELQGRIDEAARALENGPNQRRDSRHQEVDHQKSRETVEFVAGNMLFVLVHEMAHVLISEMHVPVLGHEEDAADAFAATRMIIVGNAFTHRVLAQAALGWFLSDLRNREHGRPVAYYEIHGLDRQRAYQIVCLMVGSDPNKFKELADTTKLPEARQDSCQGDYADAVWSWKKALEPYARSGDHPKTDIVVQYGDGEGRFDNFARLFSSIRLLETIAEAAADRWALPRPLTLEMRGCGRSDAHWNFPTGKITLCYEIAAEVAQLYRDYGQDQGTLRNKIARALSDKAGVAKSRAGRPARTGAASAKTPSRR